MHLRLYIERIEGDTAVVLMGEDGSVKVEMPLKWLPAGVKEGMALRMNAETDESDTDRRSLSELAKDLEKEL